MEQPFEKELELANPFEEALQLVPSWEKQIQLLGHLCQFSQNILLMLGEHSTGKSSFASLLRDYKIPGINKIMLHGNDINSPDQLMDEISKSYDNSSHQFNFSGTSQHVGEDDINGPTWAVIIDDADSLSVDTLRALLRLVDCRLPTKQQLHIILLADLGFEQVMQSDEIYEIIQDKIHPIELEAWQEEDLEYLLEKQNKFVSESFIHTLLSQSKGLPKSVMDGILNVETSSEPSHTPAFNYDFLTKLNNPITYGVSLGLFIGFGFLVYSIGDDEIPHASPVNIAIVQTEKPKIAEPNITTVDEPKVNLVFQDDITTETEPESKPEPVRQDNVPMIQSETSNQFETLELVHQSKKQDKTETLQPQQTQALKKPSQTLEPNQAVVSKITFSFTEDEREVLAQQGNNFTLQLVGSTKSPDVNQFLKENRLKSDAKLIRTTRKGKDWFIILYGSYASYDQAKKAAADIADSGKISPWVRSYKSIHSDIERLAKAKSGFVNLSKEDSTSTSG